MYLSTAKMSDLINAIAVGQYLHGGIPQEYKDELDRRFPVRPAPVSGWQPMDEAPRDGTLVVVVVDGYPEFARWNRQKDYWETTVRFVNPTHWLPLPEVPR